MVDRTELVKAVAVTAELCGTEISHEAARVLCDDLAAYPQHQVVGALQRCRREIKGRLTLAEILSRLDDGRPGPDEAWAMIPKDEAESVVWSAEMRTAFNAAGRLIEAGDMIAARMAFRETYTTEVTKARAERRDPAWQLSQGYNRRDRRDALQGRQAAVLEAVDRGRITHDKAVALLPGYDQPVTDAPRIEGPQNVSDALENIQAMRKQLSKSDGGEPAE